MAAGWYLDRVAELIEQFDPLKPPTITVAIIELHDLQQYLDNGLLPSSFGVSERAQAISRIPQSGVP